MYPCVVVTESCLTETKDSAIQYIFFHEFLFSGVMITCFISLYRCPLWSNSKVIHAEEVRDVAKKLKDELNPSLDLPHNPLDDLPEVRRPVCNCDNKSLLIMTPQLNTGNSYS